MNNNKYKLTQVKSVSQNQIYFMNMYFQSNVEQRDRHTLKIQCNNNFKHAVILINN